MAKRQRTRPGQRPPASRPARPAARPTESRPAGSLSAAEEARAAELEARIVAEERAAETARSRGRDRRRDEGTLAGYAPSRAREGSIVAARAEQEYAYVVRDVRRIVRVGGSLLIVMFVLFLVIDVAGLIKL
jgi:hypothetical protein